MRKAEFKDCDAYATRMAALHLFPKETLKSLCRHEYIAALEKAGRQPAPFVRFIRDRVCETQKELLRLMGQSIAIDDEGVNREINEGVNVLLDVVRRNPGKRANEFAGLIRKSVQSVERYVKALRETGRIEFRGAPKNGGYYSVDK